MDLKGQFMQDINAISCAWNPDAAVLIKNLFFLSGRVMLSYEYKMQQHISGQSGKMIALETGHVVTHVILS